MLRVGGEGRARTLLARVNDDTVGEGGEGGHDLLQLFLLDGIAIGVTVAECVEECCAEGLRVIEGHNKMRPIDEF